MDGADVLQVLKDDMEGAAVVRGLDNLISGLNLHAVHLDGGDALEGQARALLIVEHELVDLIGVVVVGHGAGELEADGVADVVVGAVLPAGGGAGGVVGVLDLLLKLGHVGLGSYRHVVDDLHDVEGVGVVVAGLALVHVLDEVVAAGNGEGIAVGDGAEFLALEIDVLLDNGQLLGIAAGRAGERRDNIAVDGLAGGAGAVLAPLYVGQDALKVVAGENLVDLVGVAVVGRGDGVGLLFRREAEDREYGGEGEAEDQGQELSGFLHNLFPFPMYKFLLLLAPSGLFRPLPAQG